MIDQLILDFNKSPSTWTFGLVALIILAYAALKIKNEPNDYLKKSKFFNFNQFILRIPSWWTATKNEPNLIRFERTDTRYDWFAEFWIKKTNLSNEDLLQNLIKSLNVVFDEGDEFDKISIKRIGLPEISISRKEGMSTIAGIERAYFDIFVAKIQEGTVLVGKSHSSILNGCVEGPYFEEVIQRLDFVISDQGS